MNESTRMKPISWTDIPSEDLIPTRPEPGHYLAQIRRVTDNPEKLYLRVEFDIAAGPCRNIAEDSYAWRQEARWPGWAVLYISYKPRFLRRFKQFKEQLETTNADSHFVWDTSVFDDLTKLQGLRFGVIYEEKPWEWDGRTGVHSVPTRTETGEEALSTEAPAV